MAWEWVGPVAAATSGVVVGAVGMVITWLTSKQGRDTSEEISRNTLEQERVLASEARKQQRLEDAYVELLDMAEMVGTWAQMAYPSVAYTTAPQPDPPLPSLEEQAHTNALVKAFGSDAVRQHMANWRSVVDKMITTARSIKWRESGQSVPQENEPNWRRVFDEELRPQEREERESLANQVAHELGCRSLANRIAANRNDEAGVLGTGLSLP
jgi:hypothetical protein